MKESGTGRNQTESSDKKSSSPSDRGNKQTTALIAQSQLPLNHSVTAGAGKSFTSQESIHQLHGPKLLTRESKTESNKKISNLSVESILNET